MKKNFGFNSFKHKKKFMFKRVVYRITLLIVLAISMYIFIQFDNKVRIILEGNTDILANNLATKAIDNSINAIIKQNNINTQNFIIKNLDSTDNITTLSANTVLINEICSQMALNISEQLCTLGLQKVDISIGTLTGITTLLNKGYNVSVEVLPSGTAVVNYNTEFYSTGINQMNFRVWLNVDVVVNIITTDQNRKVTINRRVTLVDTIIKGDVPPTYLNTTGENVLRLLPKN